MIFGAAARVRRRLYSSGFLRGERLPRPVVSVGNLSLGGAGKTPHVIHLARWLTERGRRVAILSRGYGRATRGVRWVSDGEGRIGGSAECGDEPVLMARRLPGIPVAVGESRAAAGREILARRPVDVFLLDDGFQHLPLQRDFDLLLVDCPRGIRGHGTAPFGPLREPPSHARFADGLVVTKCPDAAAGEAVARSVPVRAGCPSATSRFTPGEIVGAAGREIPDFPPGAELFGFSGLARNGQFRETLAAAGFRVRGFIGFPDHHAYGHRDLARIARESAGLPVLTTEKDAVRLPADVPFPVGALRVEVEYLSGWEGLSCAILDRVEGGGA
ncbi:MAG: tetraacyldisaccharide 4'-kinase [Deltaproteobacteria bacterium]|nr:tetraacyldisaccharide 4'-kinase [Deltaproteobacteria bacterium]